MNAFDPPSVRIFINRPNEHTILIVNTFIDALVAFWVRHFKTHLRTGTRRLSARTDSFHPARE